MHLAHDGHAHSVIPSRASRGDGALMPPTGPVPPPRPSTYQPARLHLRGATGTVSAQLAWPAPGASSPGLLVFLAGDPPEGQAPAPAVGLARRVGAAGALVVLALAAGSVADAVAVTQWAADHAVELGADPGRLVVGGAGAGAWLAAAVAAAARDEGWPPVACQLLVEPTDPAPPAGDLARLAPAVVLAPGADAAAAAAYAARLRAAGAGRWWSPAATPWATWSPTWWPRSTRPRRTPGARRERRPARRPPSGRRCPAGDPAELAGIDELARRLDGHRRELVGHCRGILGSAADAEDAAQETLVRAWRHLDRFEQRSSLRTWLYRIATNVCVDVTRARARCCPVDLYRRRGQRRRCRRPRPPRRRLGPARPHPPPRPVPRGGRRVGRGRRAGVRRRTRPPPPPPAGGARALRRVPVAGAGRGRPAGHDAGVGHQRGAAGPGDAGGPVGRGAARPGARPAADLVGGYVDAFRRLDIAALLALEGAAP